MTHGPVEQKHREAMHAVGDVLQEVFEGYGFCLFVFDMNAKGRMNYLSNARREDMVVALKEFLANAEGRAHEVPDARQ